jgi:hypothetical protein
MLVELKKRFPSILINIIKKKCYFKYAYEIKEGMDYERLPSTQQYPPGTQNNYVVFLKLFVVTETGKELNFPKGGKGF